MRTIYLIRHGQAGSRQQYDRLSEVGYRQARLLGEYFVKQGIALSGIVSGELQRQRATAEAVVAAYEAAGLSCPEIQSDANWNEFDLDAVYAGIGPQLGREDEQFRAEYEDLQRQMAEAASPVHRTWAKCDTTVVRAWIQGQYGFDGESFAGFQERVGKGGLGNEGPVAVFTSATPIAIWIGRTLELKPLRVMQLAGAMHNTAVNILRVKTEELRLFQYNGIPHLHDADLRTFR